MTFGLEDWVYTFSFRGKKDKNDKRPIADLKHINDGPWKVAFLPSFLYDDEAMRAGVVPLNWNSLIYRMHGDTVSGNPGETREVLMATYEDAMNAIDFHGMEEAGLSLEGRSLGSVHAFKLSNIFRTRNLIAVTPGASLIECIRKSIRTRKIYESSDEGIEKYREELDIFSPEKNLDIMNPGETGLNGETKKTDIYVALARWDWMVPYSEGMRLVEIMRKKGLNPRVETFQTGHVLGVLRANDKG